MIRINSLTVQTVAVCAGLILVGCGKSGGGAQTAPPPQVTVAQVLQKRVKDWDEFTGRLQAVETVEIRPRVSGYIDKVAFTEEVWSNAAPCCSSSTRVPIKPNTTKPLLM